MTNIANKGQTNITNQSQIIIALCEQTLNTCSVCVDMRLWFSTTISKDKWYKVM